MTLVERHFLISLRDSGALGIAESTVSKRCLAMLTQLQGAGCVQRCQGVRGAAYVVRDFVTLAKFIGHQAPLGLDVEIEESASRAEAVFRIGNAKAVAAGDCMGVFVRSTKPGMTMTSGRGVVHVSDLTKAAGGAALLLEKGTDWTFSGTSVAVIENAEAFWHHDRVLPHVDLAIWTVGRMSARRLLAWLASSSMQHCQYTHWGDYDPVGVAEYIRLRDACRDRVTMWIPENLEVLLRQHGRQSLLLKRGNLRVYSRLRHMTADPVVARFVGLFDRYHVGLEQEILLADGAAAPICG